MNISIAYTLVFAAFILAGIVYGAMRVRRYTVGSSLGCSFMIIVAAVVAMALTGNLMR